jgi:uncharacterized protein with GYD domain
MTAPDQCCSNSESLLGGRMISVYVTTGQYDVVVTVEMPNGEAMVKYVRAIAITGHARTTTGDQCLTGFDELLSFASG